MESPKVVFTFLYHQLILDLMPTNNGGVPVLTGLRRPSVLPYPRQAHREV